MNGKLNPFKRSKLDLGTFEEYFVESYENYKKMYGEVGITDYDAIKGDMKVQYDRLLSDEVYVNDEYQVFINKSVRVSELVVWHLSIKRRDKEAIHDWRDLQAIKNMLVGEEYEACELYPAESRCVDSANQYHLWCLISHPSTDTKPTFPFGFSGRYVTSDSLEGGKQRPF